MPRKSFTPIGEQARWKTIYDLLRKLDVGETLSYEALGEALDLHPKRDRTTISLAMRRATKELEQVDSHTTDNVRGVGYRVVEPAEQLGLAQRHQRKASRALARGRDKAVYVDLNGLPDETRKAFEVVAAAFAAQSDYMKRMDVRQRNLEKALNAVAVRSDEHKQETEAEVTDLRDRLARLEAKLDKPA